MGARRRGAGDHAERWLREGARFVVRVATSRRCRPCSTRRPRPRLFVHEDGSATAGQPFYEHFVYPSNDHPRDKASFTFRLDVPAGTTAVANGLPVGRLTRNGRTTWVYVQRQPMATQVTQLAVGNLELTPPAGAAACCCATSRRRRSRTSCCPSSRSRRRSSTGWRSRRRLPVRHLRRADHPRRPRLRARDADAVDLRHQLVRRAARPVGPDDGARARAQVVRQQRRAVQVERHVAQRGPRELVRVHLGRGARLPRGRHRRLAGRDRVTRRSRS